MRIRGQNFAGYLDISAPETLGDTELGWLASASQFRRSIRAGEIVFVPDEYLRFPNIKNAVNSGLIEVLSYDSRPESILINAEGGGGGSPAVPTTKYVHLDIHGGEDTVEMRDENGTPYMVLPPDVTEQIRWSLTLPSDLQPATPIYVEIFWSRGLAGSGDVQWVLEYKPVPVGSNVSTAPSFVSYTQAVPVTGFLTSTGNSLVIPGGLLVANDLLTISATRAGDDPLDTFAGNARVHLVRVVYTGLGY